MKSAEEPNGMTIRVKYAKKGGLLASMLRVESILYY